MLITGPEMIPIRKESFMLEPSTSAETILAFIRTKRDVVEVKKESGFEQFYDTFDWRLYRKKLRFTVSRNRVEISRFGGNSLYSHPGRKRSKFFWQDIDDPAFSHFLKKHIEMRALCPTVGLRYDNRLLKVLNKDRKTVAWIKLNTSTATNGTVEMELPECISVTSVRGYEKQYDRLLLLLTSQKLEKINNALELMDRSYGIGERQPLDYGAKFFVPLEPEIDIANAVSQICLNLVESMRVNFDGVYNDIDSEFLHDFRIAIRRTRSLLSLMRKYLPVDSIAYFETEFKWLGSVTGEVRDIDVYLLKRDEYHQFVPAPFSKGLDLFFQSLEERRRFAISELRSHLRSDRYESLIETWEVFLSDRNSDLFTGVKTRSCRKIVNKIVAKRFDRFLSVADQITEQTPDEALHKLRIRGKKFRYLLEFYKSFYDVDTVNIFLKHMKRVQDNLGDFNDLSVQLEMLHATVNNLKGRNKRSIQLAASLGCLVAMLRGEHQAVRGKFNRTYRSFATDENKKLMSELIKSGR